MFQLIRLPAVQALRYGRAIEQYVSFCREPVTVEKFAYQPGVQSHSSS
jgi:hypothetical protein